MHARRFHKTDALWLTLVVVAIALQFWFPPLRTGLQNDTWSTSATGKKAYYLLAQRLKPSVRRNGDPLERLAESLKRSYSGDTVVCILGPRRPPNDAEWRALLSWVRQGGRLLYAAPVDAEAFAIPDVEIRSLRPDDEESPRFVRPRDGKIQIGDLDTKLTEANDRFGWMTGNELSGPAAEPILLWEDSIQAIRQPYGQGMLVVVACDDIFSNEALTYGDNHLLAMRLLEAAGPSRSVVFDEYLNASGAPKMLAILFDTRFRPLTLQCILLLVLYCWWRSHRFGPYLPESIAPRRNIVAHTDTVGNLIFRQRDAAHPLKIYLRQLVGELRLREHRGNERRVLEPIAMRMGMPLDQVLSLFQQSTAAVKTKNLDRRVAAKLIARLARVRAAARSGKVRANRSK